MLIADNHIASFKIDLKVLSTAAGETVQWLELVSALVRGCVFIS